MAKKFVKCSREDGGKLRVTLIHNHPEQLKPEMLCTGFLLDEEDVLEPDSEKTVLKKAVMYMDEETEKVYFEYRDKPEYLDKAALQEEINALSNELERMGKNRGEITAIRTEARRAQFTKLDK